MTSNQMTVEMREFLEEAGMLASQKNRDYHPDNVAMLEILRTSFETDVSPEQDLWGRVRKQLSAIRRYVIQGHLESEPPRSRMMDVAVYMSMFAFWDQNKLQILDDAIKFTNLEPCDVAGTHFEHSAQECESCEFLVWLHTLRTNLLTSNSNESQPTPKPLD